MAKEIEGLKKRLGERGPIVYTYTVTGGKAEITYVSDNVYDILGFRAGELVSNSKLMGRLFHPDDWEDFAAAHSGSPKKGAGYTSVREFRVKDKKGAYRWLRDARRMAARPDDSVEVTGLWVDVTSSWRAEKEYKERINRYSSIIDTQKVMVCRFRPDTTLLYVNAPYAKMFGGKPEELIGRKFLELVPEPEHAGIMNNLVSLSKDDISKTYEHEVILPGGGGGWQEWTDYAILSDEGQVVEFQSVGMDITKRKTMEQKLKEYSLKLREQSLSLEQKNAAFKEMLEYVERAKNELKEDIAVNINGFVLPILEKLKVRGESSRYIDIIRNMLEELASSFGRKIIQKSGKLTPKEIEICGMLKGGLNTKEMSNLLNVSVLTVENHRRNIRGKLGIRNKRVNLVSYLRSL